MFNTNRGYVGAKRSVRSQEAINNYEVPISMINKALIEEFLHKYKEEFLEEGIKTLKNTSISKWKYVASEKVPASSWHHTSSYFNETNHYELLDVANKILDMGKELDVCYKSYLAEKNKVNTDYSYGFIKVQVWGGSRRKPKLLGHEEVAGIVVGDWLFYAEGHTREGEIKRYKVTANKVDYFKEYKTYDELIAKHKEYKNTKRVFNRIIEGKTK